MRKQFLLRCTQPCLPSLSQLQSVLQGGLSNCQNTVDSSRVHSSSMASIKLQSFYQSGIPGEISISWNTSSQQSSSQKEGLKCPFGGSFPCQGAFGFTISLCLETYDLVLLFNCWNLINPWNEIYFHKLTLYTFSVFFISQIVT